MGETRDGFLIIYTKSAENWGVKDKMKKIKKNYNIFRMYLIEVTIHIMHAFLPTNMQVIYAFRGIIF